MRYFYYMQSQKRKVKICYNLWSSHLKHILQDDKQGERIQSKLCYIKLSMTPPAPSEL